MAIEKKTIIDQIEITRDGTIQVRFGLLLVEDGVELSSQWHRTSIPPGTDPVAQIAAVNDHLQKMNKPVVDNDMIPILNTVVATLHTPEVVQTYQERAAARAELVPTKEVDMSRINPIPPGHGNEPTPQDS